MLKKDSRPPVEKRSSTEFRPVRVSLDDRAKQAHHVCAFVILPGIRAKVSIQLSIPLVGVWDNLLRSFVGSLDNFTDGDIVSGRQYRRADRIPLTLSSRYRMTFAVRRYVAGGV